MKKVNALNPDKRAALLGEFKKAMRAASDIFGRKAFRKQYSPGDSARPVSKALFEAWGVGLARRSDEEIGALADKREEVIKGFIDLMNRDWKFEAAISSSTGSPTRVRKRFQAIEELIGRCL